mmetsp:Transcript_18498/g.21208  ORF Transcript_18498/g.21208 Transcript_18498/m.21208 type:complete len:275 (+) Transcript_18498:47-871(+)
MNTTIESSITDVVIADCNRADKKQHDNVTTSKPLLKDDENEELKEMLNDPNSDTKGNMVNNSTVSSVFDKVEDEFINKRVAKKFRVLSSNKIHEKNNGRVIRIFFGIVEKPVAGKLWKIIFDDCDEDILSHVDLQIALKLYDQHKEDDNKSNSLPMRIQEDDSIDATSTSRKHGKKKTKISPKRGKKSQTPKVPRAEPEPVWVGPPAEELEGGWPKGWVKKVFARKKGTTKDRYWYTPDEKYKLRSMVEVNRFLAALSKTNGNEIMAKSMLAKK